MTTTLGDLDRRLRQKELAKVVLGLGRKYMILSGKGGVGKTTLAANLAWDKAKSGYRVGLLDIDFHGPSLAGALYLKSRVTVDDKGRLLPLLAAPNLWVLSIQNLLTREDEAVMWRGPRKMRAIAQFLSDTVWPELDYFFVDCPPGTGDEAMTVIRNIPDLKAIVVTTGHALSLGDVAKALGFLTTTGTDILGLVDNQGSLVCPGCQTEIIIYESAGVEQLARKYGLEVLAHLPLDPLAARKADLMGKPLVEAASDSILARKISELANKL